jgi:hypothetical protein
MSPSVPKYLHGQEPKLWTRPLTMNEMTYVTLKNLYFNQFAEITETKTINIL